MACKVVPGPTTRRWVPALQAVAGGSGMRMQLGGGGGVEGRGQRPHACPEQAESAHGGCRIDSTALRVFFAVDELELLCICMMMVDAKYCSLVASKRCSLRRGLQCRWCLLSSSMP